MTARERTNLENTVGKGENVGNQYNTDQDQDQSLQPCLSSTLSPLFRHSKRIQTDNNCFCCQCRSRSGCTKHTAQPTLSTLMQHCTQNQP